MYPPIVVKIGQVELDQGWDRALHVLEYYEPQNPAARRCIRILNILNDEACEYHGKGTHEGPEQPHVSQQTSTSTVITEDVIRRESMEMTGDHFVFDDVGFFGAPDPDLDWLNIPLDSSML